MALFLKTAFSPILTRKASKKTTGDISSSGPRLPSRDSAMTSSVTELMKSGDTSVPYCSSRKAWISRTVMPRVPHGD